MVATLGFVFRRVCCPTYVFDVVLGNASTIYEPLLIDFSILIYKLKNRLAISLYHRNPHVAGESSATDVCRYIDPGSVKQNTWKIRVFFSFSDSVRYHFLVQKA